MRRYNLDPRWIKAKFNSRDANGNQVKKGQEILYLPATKKVLTGKEAEETWRSFLESKQDEEFYNSQY